jgi:hypothetical protein
MSFVNILLRLIASAFVIWAIMISGYSKVSSFSGSTVSWRPEPVIFSIMWIIITLILLWIIWDINIPDDHAMGSFIKVVWWIIFLAYVSSCAWWIYSYANEKKDGIAPLIVGIMTSLMLCLIAYSDSRTSIFAVGLIVPLVWSCIALMMNIEEVRNEEV